nr:PREDICTED: cdc42 effector protein 3 [Lepisosteus oculatus]XP_015218167.1 PREDICTED: cdc42 effector protein 3 [Lepisosteus oculatus]XP_015218168.1 PREDICTED: cdc42 effector protein 3 [Lepisosteus oculatus]XP_015218169.1 PREDICTED: cdc42 effector protein 3 [Lepisosteus oculatus]XP_015218170.1 PREDICTED: cdc42 effector protein 3 [Lepisosteus oculatus]XP_015218171.1 PREDICTED: cdc42 effector protein 3 [Lepisosteus oculatus]
MPAKTPIYLKAANNKKGKKYRLRDILSPDMISPPLGDFRHTIHIGKGGEQDAFGDMSFLQGKYDLLPGKEEPVAQQHVACSEFFRANSTSDATLAETPSPVLKNAISLPAIGGSQALTLPLLSTVAFTSTPEHLDPVQRLPVTAEAKTELGKLEENELRLSMEVLNSTQTLLTEKAPKPNLSSYMPKEKTNPLENDKLHLRDNGFKNTARSYTNGNGAILHSSDISGYYADWLKDSTAEDSRLCDSEFKLTKGKSGSGDSISKITGSLLSLELDLGPSILDEVLNVMDKTKTTGNQ